MIKTLLSKTLAMAVLLTIVLYALQFVVETGIKKLDNDAYGVWNRIDRGEVNADVLVLGNSRAWVHIDPEMLENWSGLSAYNIGANGFHYNNQKALYEFYKSKNKFPKIIVQSVDLGLMSKDHNIFNKVQYMPYIASQALYDQFLSIDSSLPFDRYIPMYKYRNYYMEMVNGLFSALSIQTDWNTRQTKNKGFAAQNRQWQPGRVFNTEILIPEAEIEEGFEYLQSVINDCRKNGSVFIMVYTPQHDELKTNREQKKEIIDRFRDLAEEEGVFFFDYSQLEMNKDKKFFYNAAHLNAEGVEEFSKFLEKDLLKVSF